MHDNCFIGGMEAQRRGRPVTDAPATFSPGQQSTWRRGWAHQEKKNG